VENSSRIDFQIWSEIIYRLEVKVEIEYAKTNDDAPGKQNRWLKRNIINLTGGLSVIIDGSLCKFMQITTV
jgi:hypothetical protein